MGAPVDVVGVLATVAAGLTDKDVFIAAGWYSWDAGEKTKEARAAIIAVLAAAESVVMFGGAANVKDRMELGRRTRHLAAMLAAAGRPVKGAR